jgi:hypothetical protein
MSAAVDRFRGLDAVPDNAAPAMSALRREGVDRALEAVKDVGLPARPDFERFVVIVLADLANGHGRFLH